METLPNPPESLAWNLHVDVGVIGSIKMNNKLLSLTEINRNITLLAVLKGSIFDGGDGVFSCYMKASLFNATMP